MYHDSDFDSWWERNGENYDGSEINKEAFESYIFKKGFNKGDVLFITGIDPEDIEVGDVIIFRAPELGKDVIHRVVLISQNNGQYSFSTMGDNNGVIQGFENNINENQIIGKARVKLVPYVGWLKLIGADLWNSLLGRGNFWYVRDGFCEEN